MIDRALIEELERVSLADPNDIFVMARACNEMEAILDGEPDLRERIARAIEAVADKRPVAAEDWGPTTRGYHDGQEDAFREAARIAREVPSEATPETDRP